MSTKHLEPLSFEKLKQMDGDVVLFDDVEPACMLALVEYVEEADCVILTNNLGGRSEYYSDVEMQEDGVKAYAYIPIHIDRSKWKPCKLCSLPNGKPAYRLILAETCGGEARFCPECGRPLTDKACAELELKLSE